jgi:hypothetical protein
MAIAARLTAMASVTAIKMPPSDDTKRGAARRPPAAIEDYPQSLSAVAPDATPS